MGAECLGVNRPPAFADRQRAPGRSV